MESRDGSQAAAGARQPTNEIRKEVHRQEFAHKAQAVSICDANSQALIRRGVGGLSVTAKRYRQRFAFVPVPGFVLAFAPAQPGAIKAPILVCHGALAPHNPPAHVRVFVEEMNHAAAEWQLIVYGGAMHGFTHETATGQTPASYTMPSATRGLQRRCAASSSSSSARKRPSPVEQLKTIDECQIAICLEVPDLLVDELRVLFGSLHPAQATTDPSTAAAKRYRGCSGRSATVRA